jgi:hypothetical protein
METEDIYYHYESVPLHYYFRRMVITVKLPPGKIQLTFLKPIEVGELVTMKAGVKKLCGAAP